MNNIQVMLSEEQTESLKMFVFDLTKEAISEAKHMAGMDKPFLKQGEMAKWLGISVNTLKKLEVQEGLPSVTIDGLKLYSKEEVTKFLLSKQK